MNWCHNTLYITGKACEIEAFCEMLRNTKWDEFESRNVDCEINAACRKLPDYSPDEETDVTVFFDTPYNPQIAFFEQAADKLPRLRLELCYMEPLGSFAGRALFEGGELVKQEPSEIEYVEIDRESEAGKEMQRLLDEMCSPARIKEQKLIKQNLLDSMK